MNPQNMQANMQPDQQIHPDDARSALGFATMLTEQHMKAQNPQPQPSQTPQNAPQQEKGENMNNPLEETESRIMDEIKSLKEEIKASAPKDKNKELEDLKKEIEDVLKQDD